MINNQLKIQCETCNFLELETNMTTMYADNEIASREIKIDCKNRAVCDVAEQRSKDGAVNG